MKFHHLGSSPSTHGRGFTLVEMVIVIVLLGILAAVGAPMIANGMRVAVTTGTGLDTLSQMRYATERLARELREVRLNGSTYDISAASLPVTFTKVDGTVVKISLTGSNLRIDYGATSTVLSNQASNLTLAYTNVIGTVSMSNPSFIDLSLALANATTGASYTQNTRVTLRNL
ncbi:MAG: type II secretion system protein [Gammaproteobacteria bacterium]|nr:type II secretion system protein [Gammaproteobacteria bacterium]